MLADLLGLLVLSAIMAGASFFAGSLPLALSLTSRQLRLIAALGTGILVGTSLIVIIPEGVSTLYQATQYESRHTHALSAPLTYDPSLPPRSAIDTEWSGAAATVVSRIVDDVTIHESGKYVRASADEELHSHSAAAEEAHDDKGHDPHAWIGISLIAGFVLMYLIDVVPQSAIVASRPKHFAVSLNRISINRRTPSVSSESGDLANGDTFSGNANSRSNKSRPNSTTIGLVVHAAADGIALGASSVDSSSNLNLIIFIALLIHKAPAGFGLTTVLLKQGLSKQMARLHLLAFSLAAPIGAILTWAVIHLFSWVSASRSVSAPEAQGNTTFATGMLLLFSGGTFLYVAMHTMQEGGEVAKRSHHHHPSETIDSNGYASVLPMDEPYGAQSSAAAKQQDHPLLDVAVTVAGMLLPLLTQWGDTH